MKHYILWFFGGAALVVLSILSAVVLFALAVIPMLIGILFMFRYAIALVAVAWLIWGQG